MVDFILQGCGYIPQLHGLAENGMNYFGSPPQNSPPGDDPNDGQLKEISIIKTNKTYCRSGTDS